MSANLHNLRLVLMQVKCDFALSFNVSQVCMLQQLEILFLTQPFEP